jgi:hypothetical protein
MRSFWQAVEAGLHTVRLSNLADGMDRDDLDALHAAGILRPTGNFDLEELSWTDLSRALRALFGIEGRGLPAPARCLEQAASLGWIRGEQGEVQVFLVARPRLQLAQMLKHPMPALLLLPTARGIRKALRAKHGPGARVRIEVLQESITCSRRRLARASHEAPDAPELPAPAPPPAVPRRARPGGRTPPVVPIPGAKRWHDLQIQPADEERIRIVLHRRTYFRTAVGMGMAHARTHAPTKQWHMLRHILDNDGVYVGYSRGNPRTTRKACSRLSDDLRRVFLLQESCFHRYARKEGWQVKFRVDAELPVDPRER